MPTLQHDAPPAPSTTRRPAAERMLIALLLFQGISGVLGGGMLVLSPEGSSSQLPAWWLDHIPFDSRFWPGVILGVGLGISALVIAYGVLHRPAWPGVRFIEAATGHHWSWAASIALGVGLIAWIVVELVLIPMQSWLQPLYLAVGVGIVASALVDR